MNSIKTTKRAKILPDYTYLGCPMTKNRTPWCFRICRPNPDGTGQCGRVAPHTLKGNIQQGIIDFKMQREY
jgi:hypothetical protein